MSSDSTVTRKKALIFGISGQDGAYLAELLLGKKYEVHGTSRDCENNAFTGLQSLGILDKVKLHSVALTDFRSVIRVLYQVLPEEIYNLAGQSSVGLSFEQPVETFESISVATINILECIRLLGRPIRLFSTASSECFGNTETAADETTPFHPRSPYALAKAAAFWTIANYREAYNMYACSGIMFNHESPIRPERFVTQKTISTALRIAEGQATELRLGNASIVRDWGWAPEYVEAMWLMLQHAEPIDLVIATGHSHSLLSFIELAFESVGLDWKKYVKYDQTLKRPSDLSNSLGNPEKARRSIGWEAKVGFDELVRRLIEEKRKQLFKPAEGPYS